MLLFRTIWILWKHFENCNRVQVIFPLIVFSSNYVKENNMEKNSSDNEPSSLTNNEHKKIMNSEQLMHYSRERNCEEKDACSTFWWICSVIDDEVLLYRRLNNLLAGNRSCLLHNFRKFTFAHSTLNNVREVHPFIRESRCKDLWPLQRFVK